MVKHTVMFKLRGSKEERLETSRRFAEALEALPAQIECLKSMETGINNNPNEDWDIVLTAIIDKMENVDVYAKHPAHVKAASIIAPLKEARGCVDYEFREPA